MTGLIVYNIFWFPGNPSKYLYQTIGSQVKRIRGLVVVPRMHLYVPASLNDRLKIE